MRRCGGRRAATAARLMMAWLLGLAQLAGAATQLLHCDVDGTMSVAVGADRWSLDYAGAGLNASTWDVVATPDGGCDLTATVAGSYRLQRRARLETGGTITITEVFTNLRSSDVALWWEVNITGVDAEPAFCVQQQWNEHVTEVASSCIDVGGRYNLTHSSSFGWMKFYDGHGTGPVYDDPPFNPTVYLRGPKNGLGLVALDDWMRRGLRMHKAARSAFWGVHNFGVPASSTVNFSWALFPTPNSSGPDAYYDFINAVRDATVQPLTVKGPGAFIPYDFAQTWPTEKLRTLVRALGGKHMAATICGPLQYGGAPWLGNDGYCNEQHFNITLCESRAY